jgi:Short C-terminal domain
VGKRVWVAAGAGRVVWTSLLLGLIAPALATAAIVSVGGISVGELADALQQQPVQQRGHPRPGLTAKQVRNLAALVEQRDAGRIWIAVVTPLTVQATGDLTQALSDAVTSDGVYVVVAGSNYHVTTSWESGESARRRLAAAVDRPGDSLYVQLRRTIDSFATADAAAGHPGSQSTEQTGPASTSHSSPSSHSSGSAGVISGIVITVVVLVLLGAGYARRARGSLRAAHWRKEQEADVHAQAQADFVKLGDDIAALDIDSSMPNANPEAKDEYAKALDAYQDAEQRLKQADDDYQFAQAQDALRRGAQHIEAAQQLFSAAPPPVSAGVLDQISKLAKLHEDGALTDAEFAAEKHKLLGE